MTESTGRLRLLLVGATGAVGRAVLAQALASEPVSQVIESGELHRPVLTISS